MADRNFFRGPKPKRDVKPGGRFGPPTEGRKTFAGQPAKPTNPSPNPPARTGIKRGK